MSSTEQKTTKIYGKTKAEAANLPDPPLDSTYAAICETLRDQRLGEMVMGAWPLEWDEMRQRACLGRKPLEDEGFYRIRETMQTLFRTPNGSRLRYGKDDIFCAAAQVAKERPFHEVADYLDGLPPWDRIERIDRLPETVLGLEPDMFNTVTIRKWLISAVARALRPGCKVDTCLILSGPQGIGKSSFFRVLCGEQWVSDTAIDVRSKDAVLGLGESWVIEWAELQAVLRADQEAVKAFLSSATDRIRLPYGRIVTTMPRRSVIVGTTNETEFLSDTTGNRRSWTLALEKKVALELLEFQRDKYWAEAVHAFRAGERWWFDAEEDLELGRRQKGFERSDPWDDAISDHLLGKTETTSSECLSKVGKEHGHLEKRDEMRVGGILKRLGWERSRKYDGKTRVRLWTKLE